MTARRSRGEGSLFWHEGRQRWIAIVDAGFTPEGKRRRRHISGKTKTEAKAKLLQARKEMSEGLPAESPTYTVAEAVQSWLTYGLSGKDPNTVENCRILAEGHVIPALGQRKLLELTTRDIDRWLAAKAQTLSSDTINRLLSILRRSIKRAQALDIVRRNVALLCDPPHGQSGRPSKALTLPQAKSILAAAKGKPLNAYVVTALLTGARTEELRALTWEHLSLDSDPPYIDVWRSVRRGGDTKTERSRRTLELPQMCVDALSQARAQRHELKPGDFVFATSSGGQLDAANVRRGFRGVVAAAGLDPSAWTPRELRHSFVSLLSSSGMPIEDISHLVGHGSTRVTERVYRKELRPVLTRGAKAMDAIFESEPDR